MEEQSQSFTIEVDLYGNGTKLEILVIPEDGEASEDKMVMVFVTILDGVTLAKVKRGDNDGWIQKEGSLDQPTVDVIGSQIESHYL